jgi:hypothetical protein
MTSMYRAAPEHDPYFGRRSYWTTSAEFAESFAVWANNHPGLQHLGTHVLYRAEVDLAGLLEYSEPMATEIIDACTGLLAAEGHQWVAFHERGRVDGLDPAFASLVRSHKQYVYLGTIPVAAERWARR